VFSGLASFQPFDKRLKIRWIDVVEPAAILFKCVVLDINGVGAKIIKVSRDESKLLALLKLVTGWLAVRSCLSEAAIVHLPCKLFIHPHGVNELPMADASPTRPARTYDPISFVRHFNNVSLALTMLAEFAEAQRTKTTIGVRRDPSVMINDVGVNLHDKPPYRPSPEASCAAQLLT
jgi:hypothetical protein